MNSQLVEIEPRELKFIFELKKQSTCPVRLTNNTKHYVAFKVKTTTPKKYCVRPNVGVIRPKSACDFTVIMQSQGVAPPDMACKDKFLIQSTVVPDGTIDEDIKSSMFSKDDGKYIQENKLRVILISPPNSPAPSPINEALNQGLVHEASILKDPVLSRVEILTAPHVVAKNVEGSEMFKGDGLKPAKPEELKPRKDVVNIQELKPKKDAELKPKDDVIKSHGLNPAKIAEFKPKEDVVDRKELEIAKDAETKPRKTVFTVEEFKPLIDAELNRRKDVIDIKESIPATDAELYRRKDVIDSNKLKPEENSELNPSKEAVNSEELQPRKDTELKPKKDVEFETVKAAEELKLVGDIEEMKAKLNELTAKLSKAEVTISKLAEERRLSTKERKFLQGELEMLRNKAVVKNVQVGYPLLFVCMVALISFVVGCRVFS